jgi:hypothetical protein
VRIAQDHRRGSRELCGKARGIDLDQGVSNCLNIGLRFFIRTF